MLERRNQANTISAKSIELDEWVGWMNNFPCNDKRQPHYCDCLCVASGLNLATTAIAVNFRIASAAHFFTNTLAKVVF